MFYHMRYREGPHPHSSWAVENSDNTEFPGQEVDLHVGSIRDLPCVSWTEGNRSSCRKQQLLHRQGLSQWMRCPFAWT